MRKTCLECVVKHLGAAAVYIEECAMGYPDYYGYAVGELCHASSESLSEFPVLAMIIREHRIKWMETRKAERRHVIPFEALFGYVDALEQAGETLEPPASVLEGITDKDGSPAFSMDTRP